MSDKEFERAYLKAMSSLQAEIGRLDINCWEFEVEMEACRQRKAEDKKAA